MMSEIQDIKIVVAYNYRRFVEICISLGLNPRRIKFVSTESNIAKELTGFYRESIYPERYGQSRPPAPKYFISIEDHDNL